MTFSTQNRPLRIFIIAGEASGDILGAGFMRAMKEKNPAASFYGVGGAHMIEEGLQSLFPMEELSVMGIAEVLPKIFSILSRIRLCVREILSLKPDALVTIDSPDFCFRVVKRVKAKTKNIPCVHYVAPSVWAWRPGRAKKVAGFLDHLLTLLPFEPEYFHVHGLGATFVGHPIVERISHRGDGERFRKKYDLTSGQPILTILPGSRMSEVERLLGIFRETSDIIVRAHHHAVIVIPTLPHLKPYIDKFFRGLGINPLVVTGDEDKFDCFAASIAAIAASGTVTLELAMADTPHIGAYKMHPLTAMLAKKVVKTPFVNLINIIMRRPVVPELLLENCKPLPITRAVLHLMEDRDARANQLLDFRQALLKMGLGDPETPSHKAANTVLKVIEARRNP